MTVIHAPANSQPPVTLLLTTYQQARFVREAVRSVLAQEYRPLEILISDDASTDGTFEVLQDEVAAYRGPHDVMLRRNPVRLDRAHTLAVVQTAKHEIVVMAHGDDIQSPQRVARLMEAMLRSGAALVSSDAEMIDADGNHLGLLEGSGRSRHIPIAEIVRTGWQPTMLGATFAFSRSIQVEMTRDLDASPPALDAIGCFRAALASSVHFVGEPLLRYRRHATNAGNFTADFTSSPAIFKETVTALELSVFGWMLGDLGAWVARKGRSQKLDAIENRLQDVALGHIDAMVMRRLALMSQGLMPGWLSRAEFADRKIRDEYRLKARPASATEEAEAPT